MSLSPSQQQLLLKRLTDELVQDKNTVQVFGRDIRPDVVRGLIFAFGFIFDETLDHSQVFGEFNPQFPISFKESSSLAFKPLSPKAATVASKEPATASVEVEAPKAVRPVTTQSSDEPKRGPGRPKKVAEPEVTAAPPKKVAAPVVSSDDDEEESPPPLPTRKPSMPQPQIDEDEDEDDDEPPAKPAPKAPVKTKPPVDDDDDDDDVVAPKAPSKPVVKAKPPVDDDDDDDDDAPPPPPKKVAPAPAPSKGKPAPEADDDDDWDDED